MGFFSNLGGAVLNGAKEWSEEANEYYEEAMSISDDDEFKEELRRVRRGSNMAKRVGYNKAAKERGIN